jgi:hypothetical protein
VDASHPAQRAAEQAVRLPAAGALTGWASLHLQGATYFDGLAPDGATALPVPLALGCRGNIRASPDSTLLRDPLPAGEVVRVYGLPCAAPERAAFDAIRTAPSLVEAVVVADMVCEAELTSLERLRRYVSERAGWRGAPQARAALELAEENSWSPNEVRMRMVWELEAGLPRPLVNRPVFDLRGRLLGYPDLLDVESGLVGEYDGADHRRAARHSKDVGREHAFRTHGLEVTRVTGPDLRRPGLVRDRILESRARALSLPETERPWTLEPPAGWDPELPLEVRLVAKELIVESRREAERGG